MTDLAKKYRPQRFGEVAGQPKADAWFRRQVISKEARSVLLSGPYGTGKTTLGLLYGKALFCEATEDGEPCGTCDRCKEFGDFEDLTGIGHLHTRRERRFQRIIEPEMKFVPPPHERFQRE
jgi:DNA polymerase III gamma/tau subunit